MEVLNLKESRNSLMGKLNYFKRKCEDERINELVDEIKMGISSFEKYKEVDEEIERLNIKWGNLLKDYDPFEEEDVWIDSDDEDSDIFEEAMELDWWEIEDNTEKKQTIRFSLPNLLDSVEFNHFESLRRISRRLDLYDRIRQQRVTREITDELKDSLFNFLQFCVDYMDKEKWAVLKPILLNRNKSEIYDDFRCNRINQQLNECCSEPDYDLLKDVDDIECVEQLFAANKKVDDLQHSSIIKIAILYRLNTPCFNVFDEIRDIYELIVNSEMNFYRVNLLKILLDEML